MEEKVKIPTRDGHTIYGTLNDAERPAARLVIFVHGLTGSRKEHQYYGAARLFPAKGYATFRFNLYSRDENARVLSDASIRSQSDDLDTVISYFKDRYAHLFLVGHSLGGPTIMGADLDPVTAIVLWDPSITPNLTPGKDLYPYPGRPDTYIIKWQLEYLVSKELLEEWGNARALIRRLSKPTRIVFAGAYTIKPSWGGSLADIPAEHDAVTIEGASHGFDEEGAQERLYAATLEWLDRHSGQDPK